MSDDILARCVDPNINSRIEGLPWGLPVDLFSLGCILSELYLGRRLFIQTNSSCQRLAILERILGPFPTAFASQAASFFSFSPEARVLLPNNSAMPDNVLKSIVRLPSLNVS